MKERNVEMSQEWGQNTHFVRISDTIEIFTILVLSMVDRMMFCILTVLKSHFRVSVK